MAKHNQIIRRQIADELFECVWPYFELELKGLKVIIGYQRLTSPGHQFVKLALKSPVTIEQNADVSSIFDNI